MAKKSGSKKSKRTKRRGLPKAYIKAAGGNLKKAWAAYRRAHEKGHSRAKGRSKKGRLTVSVKRPGRKSARVTLSAAEASEAAERKKRRKKSKSRRKRARHERSIDSIAQAIVRDKTRLANLRSVYETKLANYRRRLESAEGAERARLERQIVKLKQKLAEAEARHAERERMFREKLELAKAAEKKRRHRRRRHGHMVRENPISGLGESLAAGGGALVGILATVLPYRAIRSHKLLDQAPQPGANTPGTWYDVPAPGDVPNLSTAQLPVWSKMKWKGLAAIATFLGLDVLLPFAVAAAVPEEHRKTKTFFEVWGVSALTLGGAKLIIDVAAAATKNTKTGNRLFAPENVARSLRSASAQSSAQGGALPVISVTPGVGLPGLVGPTAPDTYGRGAMVVKGGCGCQKTATERSVTSPPPAATVATPPPAATSTVQAPPPAATVATPPPAATSTVQAPPPAATVAPLPPAATATVQAPPPNAFSGAGSVYKNNVTPIRRMTTTPMRRAFGRR